MTLQAGFTGIAEAHGGSLAVRNRPVGRGTEAVIRMPSTVRQRSG